MHNKSDLSNFIKEKAIETGFDDCGISSVEILQDESLKLKDWLSAKMHADMIWMEKNIEKRKELDLMVPGAKSVISLVLNYKPSEDLEFNSRYKISKYAYGKDYHQVIKKMLKHLAKEINKKKNISWRSFTDSAPVFEKSYAQRAGLGWIGKNSSLLNKEFGSFFFLAELVVDIELEYDKLNDFDYCGNCTKCLDSCPTEAINDDRTINSNKCISYHTIENKSDISSSLHKKLNNYIFGCDICQNVCPWNSKTAENKVKGFQPSEELLNLTDADWERMTENQFNDIFKQSPLKRSGYKKIKSNIQFVNK